MSDHEGSRDREEYADWSPPGTDETRTDTGEGRSVDLEGEPPADGEDEEWDKPSTIREPLFRDRVRERHVRDRAATRVSGTLPRRDPE